MKNDKLIKEIAVEIDRLLNEGIEIHPNSPIHEKLHNVILQLSDISNKPKQKTKKVTYNPNWFTGWNNVIKEL
jgi:hypothetical protein